MDTSGNNRQMALYTVLIGCTPKGRNVEQHDVFFGVAATLDDLIDDIKTWWHRTAIADVDDELKKFLPVTERAAFHNQLASKLAKRDKMHIDAWTRVEFVDGYRVIIKPADAAGPDNGLKLYFINLGGYRENDFEEYHKKFFVVAPSAREAIEKGMRSDFMRDYNPAALGQGGKSHLDDKIELGFEADDIICVNESLAGQYVIEVVAADAVHENETVIGYTRLDYAD